MVLQGLGMAGRSAVVLGGLWLGGWAWVGLPAGAQLLPDATLGAEASVVMPGQGVKGAPAELIEGGALRGGNLFHSFSEFNVAEGQRVYFANPVGIENILSRVTGNNLSNILGTLGVDGAADLFLINPNGIIFGENSSLDLQGSFVGTTASGIQFEGQGFFSAKNPESPSQILKVNPSIFLFNQDSTGAIENRSRANVGRDPSNTFDALGLRVPDGKNLILLGGDINFFGGIATAFGGNIQLGGIKEIGNVGLNMKSDSPNLEFSEAFERANVSLSNNSGVIVSGAGGGNTTLYAQDIKITEGSSIEAGILPTLGTLDTQAGNIVLDARGSILISDFGSNLYNYVSSNASGKTGDISIKANSLRISNSAQVATYLEAESKGESGNIIAKASNLIEVRGRDSNRPSFLGTAVLANAKGKGGSLIAETNQFSIREGAEVATYSSGNGNAGSLTIHAQDSLEVIGAAGLLTRLSADIGRGGVGDSGDMNITTTRLLVDSGQISTSIQGEGKTGDLSIDASESVELRGEIFDRDGIARFPGGVFSQVDVDAKGQGGNLTIETTKLSISDGSKVQVGTFGNGNAGNLIVRASQIDVFNTAQSRERFRTGIFGGILQDPNSTILPRGNGGSITIYAERLSIRDGARVTADVSGVGIGGDIFIQANELLEIVGSSRRFTPSNLGSTVRASSPELSREKGVCLC